MTDFDYARARPGPDDNIQTTIPKTVKHPRGRSLWGGVGRRAKLGGYCVHARAGSSVGRAFDF
jgi:hypothetical protein